MTAKAKARMTERPPLSTLIEALKRTFSLESLNPGKPAEPGAKLEARKRAVRRERVQGTFAKG